MGQMLLLATWLGWVGAAVGVGLLVVRVVRIRAGTRDEAQAALWVGLVALLLLASGLSIVAPVGGRWGAGVAICFLVVGWSVASTRMWSDRSQIGAGVRRGLHYRRLPILATLGLFIVGWLSLANFATLEPKDYDTGLYRLGAILYASDYGIVPGLANLQDRFGFNTSMSPFAALLGSIVWAENGYRVVTGLCATFVLADLLIRTAVPRVRGPRAGDWYAMMIAAFIAFVILTNPGRWASSPAIDIVFLALAAVSTALLVDFVTAGRRAPWTGSVALILAAAAGSIRPLGWILGALTAMVVIALSCRRAFHSSRHPQSSRTSVLVPVAAASVISGTLFVIMLIRDYYLSGWLLFPLSRWPMDVPWRTEDPTNTREWVTSWGRAPWEDKDVVLADSSWLGPWLLRLTTSGEFAVWLLVALLCALPLASTRGRRAWRACLPYIPWALVPALGTTIVWFLSAPDIRFAWAFPTSLVMVPAALLLWKGAFPASAVRVGGVAILIVGVIVLTTSLLVSVMAGRFKVTGTPRQSTEVTLGPWNVDVQLAPPRFAGSTPGALADGTPILYPVSGELCWSAFPLCLPPGAGSNVARRGAKTEDGFVLVPR